MYLRILIGSFLFCLNEGIRLIGYCLGWRETGLVALLSAHRTECMFGLALTIGILILFLSGMYILILLIKVIKFIGGIVVTAGRRIAGMLLTTKEKHQDEHKTGQDNIKEPLNIDKILSLVNQIVQILMGIGGIATIASVALTGIWLTNHGIAASNAQFSASMAIISFGIVMLFSVYILICFSMFLLLSMACEKNKTRSRKIWVIIPVLFLDALIAVIIQTTLSLHFAFLLFLRMWIGVIVLNTLVGGIVYCVVLRVLAENHGLVWHMLLMSTILIMGCAIAFWETMDSQFMNNTRIISYQVSDEEKRFDDIVLVDDDKALYIVIYENTNNYCIAPLCIASESQTNEKRDKEKDKEITTLNDGRSIIIGSSTKIIEKKNITVYNNVKLVIEKLTSLN